MIGVIVGWLYIYINLDCISVFRAAGRMSQSLGFGSQSVTAPPLKITAVKKKRRNFTERTNNNLLLQKCKGKDNFHKIENNSTFLPGQENCNLTTYKLLAKLYRIMCAITKLVCC